MSRSACLRTRGHPPGFGSAGPACEADPLVLAVLALWQDITVHLDELLEAKAMTLVELSAHVGVTVANLSILKNGHARAIRFNTLTAICEALQCTPGEILRLQPRGRRAP